MKDVFQGYEDYVRKELLPQPKETENDKLFELEPENKPEATIATDVNPTTEQTPQLSPDTIKAIASELAQLMKGGSNELE